MIYRCVHSSPVDLMLLVWILLPISSLPPNPLNLTCLRITHPHVFIVKGAAHMGHIIEESSIVRCWCWSRLNFLFDCFFLLFFFFIKFWILHFNMAIRIIEIWSMESSLWVQWTSRWYLLWKALFLVFGFSLEFELGLV